MTHDAHTDLRNVVQAIIDARKAEERLSPAWIATEAMTKLGAAYLQKTKPLVYLAAHLAMRQIARNACRKHFEEPDDDEAGLVPAQQELFPGLQYRYPAAHAEDDEPTYVLRDSMTEKDVRFNVQRLRKEGQSKIERADSLEAWWRTRQRAAAVAKRTAAAVSPAA